MKKRASERHVEAWIRLPLEGDEEQGREDREKSVAEGAYVRRVGGKEMRVWKGKGSEEIDLRNEKDQRETTPFVRSYQGRKSRKKEAEERVKKGTRQV